MLALILALVATASAAMAGTDTSTTRKGWIKLAHGPFNAVTAWGAPCRPKSPLNGIDGVWYKVSPGSTEVTMTPATTLDADLLFRRFDRAGNRTVVSAQNNDIVGGDCESMEAGDFFG